jgi:hypothetical protein
MSDLSPLWNACYDNDYEAGNAAIAKLTKEQVTDALIIAIDGPWQAVMGDGWHIFDDDGCKIGWGSFTPSVKDASRSLAELAKLCTLFDCMKGVPDVVISMANNHLAQASLIIAERIQKDDLEEQYSE